MINFQINKVIDYLEGQAALTGLLASVDYEGTPSPAIYRNIPESEDVDGIYITLSEAVDVPDATLSNTTLIEARIIAGNEKVTYTQIKAVDNKLKELLQNNFDYGTFKVYNTVVKSGRELLNDKDRKEYVRDYEFYFLG